MDEDDGEVFGFSGYPNYSCPYKFTYFDTNNPKTSLFGFKVGDSVEKADKQLRKNKYTREEIDGKFAISVLICPLDSKLISSKKI